MQSAAHSISRLRTAALAALLTLPLASFAAEATIIHTFGAKGDGNSPGATMTFGTDGKLYGTTTFGGTHQGGTVFRLTPPASGPGLWAEDILLNFAFSGDNQNQPNSTGANPRSALWLGEDGALFGTTTSGGASGAGNIFQLAPPAAGAGGWTQSIVHSFEGGDVDGTFPEGSPIAVAGSTARFGVTLGGGPANEGTFYALTPATPGTPASLSLLYSFVGPEGSLPLNDLVADAKGNLYGVAFSGGANGWGSIFRLAPAKAAGGAWTETTLFSFTAGADGRAPEEKLVIDDKGALWGTSFSGGRKLTGSLYRLAPPKKAGQPWVFKNFHVFNDIPGGEAPLSPLLPDGAGGFYGTTAVGGAKDCGTVYHFQPPAKPGDAGVLTTLYSFPGGQGGTYPAEGLVLKDGTLYGTTYGADKSDSVTCKGASVAYALAL